MKNLLQKSAIAVGSMFTAGATLAQDHSAAITAAQTAATGNVTSTATAVIAIVAVVAGVSFIISLFKKT